MTPQRQPITIRLSPLERGLLDRNSQPAALMRGDAAIIHANPAWTSLFGEGTPFSTGSGYRLWTRDGESVASDAGILRAASGALVATDGTGIRIELIWTVLDDRIVLVEAFNLTATQNALRQRQQLLNSLPDAAALRRQRGIHDLNNAMFAAAAAHSQAAEMLWSDQADLHEQMNLLGDALQMIDDIAGELLDRRAAVAGACTADQLGRQAVALARAAFGSTPAEIEVVSGKNNLLLDADRFQLLRALQNLLLNALHAASDNAAVRPPRASLKISAGGEKPYGECGHRIGNPQPDRHYIQFDISDSGAGIPPGIMSHIFEPYRSTRPPHIGTGLGLATVAEVAMSCGGYVDVWAQHPDSGTKPGATLPGAFFRFSVPIDEFGPVSSSVARTVCVMIGDDALRERLTAWLRRGGYSVMSGGEPCGDLVVADSRLPLPPGRPLIQLGSAEGASEPVPGRICLDMPVYGQHFMRAVRHLCPVAKLP